MDDWAFTNLILGVLGLLVGYAMWARHLKHKETMKKIECGYPLDETDTEFEDDGE